MTAFITILDDEVPGQGTDRPSLAMCVTDQILSGAIYEPLFFQVGATTTLTVDLKDNDTRSVGYVMWCYVCSRMPTKSLPAHCA